MVVGSNVGVLMAQAGASGTGGGAAGDVSFSNNGDVQTTGANATGIVAQAIGGGGGISTLAAGAVSGTPLGVVLDNGGSAASSSDGGAVSFPEFAGTVLTTGDLSQGVVAQSIGGGGGLTTVSSTSGFDVGANGITNNVGGTGGSGSGKTVTLTTPDMVVTQGNDAAGLVLQSIGGGGGFSSLVSAGSQNPTESAVSVGGADGSTGDGGVIEFTSQGVISTSGIGSAGVIAQSVGGGGGVASAVGVGAVNGVTLGGGGGATGKGGDVTVTVDAGLSTTGAGSAGVIAQSIGGGGGLASAFTLAGGTVTGPVTLASGGTGNGGVATVNINGAVMTTGANADGVIAQSVGGGGGIAGVGTLGSDPAFGLFIGSAGGTGAGGAVKMNVTGDVLATGAGSNALVANSSGGAGANGDITIDIVSPSATDLAIVEGGSGQGAGVQIVDGADNVLNNGGAVTTISGIDGYAVRAASGNDVVNNTNLMIGSVDLGTGANAYNNGAAAVFDVGTIANLGAGNDLTNDGLLSPGFYENVQTTNLAGNFVQSASGTYGLDLDLLPQTTDEIIATGTANVSGTVYINLLNPGQAQTGSHDNTIVYAMQGVTGHQGLTISAIPSAVATYKLLYTDPNNFIDKIVLNYDINYSPAGLNRNEHSEGNAINFIQTDRTSPAFVPIAAALFYQPTVPALASVYDILSGEGTVAAEQVAFDQDDRLISAIDARVNDEMTDFSADGGLPAGQEPWARRTHVWTQGYGFNTVLAGQASTGSAGVRATGSAGIVGLDHWITEHFVVGAAVAGGTSTYVVPDRATQGTVYSTNVAGYAAWSASHAYVNAVLDFGSYGDNERRSAAIPGIAPPSLSGTPVPPIPGFAENLTAQYASHSTGGQIETGWRMMGKTFGLTPFAAMRVTSLQMDPYTETQTDGSASQIGLSYHSRDIFSAPAFLGGQFDAATPVGYTGRLRAFVRLAWMHDFAPYRSINASFISAPAYDFTILGATPPRDSARLDAGLNLEIGAHTAFFGSFSSDVAGRDTVYSGTGGVRVAW
jgi:uncharacterized protein with beta-barrel porin domain